MADSERLGQCFAVDELRPGDVDQERSGFDKRQLAVADEALRRWKSLADLLGSCQNFSREPS